MNSYDDIFRTDESRAEEALEKVQPIAIDKLVPFKNHPFKVVDDEAMLRTTESIAQYGVLTPLIARPREGGTYEIISGHRRAHAALAAGLTEVPVPVRQMDDDAATVLMVDSNLQRENILPSERAFAYKMKLEAMKHQGSRSDLTSFQIGTKLRADEEMANEVGSSRNQIQRYIRHYHGHNGRFGLGLAIAKAGMEHLSGTISAESKKPPQHGASFCLCMPLAEAAEERPCE